MHFQCLLYVRKLTRSRRRNICECVCVCVLLIVITSAKLCILIEFPNAFLCDAIFIMVYGLFKWSVTTVYMFVYTIKYRAMKGYHKFNLTIVLPERNE